MKTNRFLAKNLCQALCPYYRPGKKEALACRGFLVIQDLIETGKEIPFAKPDKMLDASTKDILLKRMCVTCSFYEGDCDFASQKEKSMPCGGFTLVGRLLEANRINVDDLKDTS